MTNGQLIVETDRSRNGTISPSRLEELRMRTVARRRIEQRQTAKWFGNRSRREKMRTVAVCVGTLLLMALGIYFGLSGQDATGSGQGATPTRPVAIVQLV